MFIVGAGLAGLIAAHAFPKAVVVEANEKRENHKALLRFRSDEISKLTDIPFKPVTVHKGICHKGQFVQPNIQYSNMYCYKVLGEIRGSRSIWNLETTTRYIAPRDFYERLIENIGTRVTFETSFDFLRDAESEAAVSTAPLPIAAKACGIPLDEAFKRSPIVTYRYELKGVSDVYQTIYIADIDAPVYRASITDDLLIIECIEAPTSEGQMLNAILALFFGNKIKDERFFDVKKLDATTQEFGKIAPIDDNKRKAIIHQLTDQHNIFSLGRFATWRNILLDDLVKDIEQIKQLMNCEKYRRSIMRK